MVHSKISAFAFALLWVGAMSIYWIHIKMSAPLQALIGAGVSFPFPLSMLYIGFVYLVAMATISIVGLSIYLALVKAFRVRTLFLGSAVIFLVLAICWI